MTLVLKQSVILCCVPGYRPDQNFPFEPFFEMCNLKSVFFQLTHSWKYNLTSRYCRANKEEQH